MSNNKHIKRTLNISRHIEKNLGPIYSTISLTTPQTNHDLTMIIVSPTKNRNNYFVVTSGVSQISSEKDECGIEFIIGMHLDWTPPKDEDDFIKLKEIDKFPFCVMALLAEYSELHDVTLGIGSTVGMNFDKLSNFRRLLIYFAMINPEFEVVSLAEEEAEGILVFGLYPITEREFDIILKNEDRDEAFDQLRDSGLSLVFDPKRI